MVKMLLFFYEVLVSSLVRPFKLMYDFVDFFLKKLTDPG